VRPLTVPGKTIDNWCVLKDEDPRAWQLSSVRGSGGTEKAKIVAGFCWLSVLRVELSAVSIAYVCSRQHPFNQECMPEMFREEIRMQAGTGGLFRINVRSSV